MKQHLLVMSTLIPTTLQMTATAIRKIYRFLVSTSNNVSQGSNCYNLVDACKQRRDDKAECKTLAEYTMNTRCFVSLFYNERTIDPEGSCSVYQKTNELRWLYDSTRSWHKKPSQWTRLKVIKSTLHYYDYQNKGGDTIKKHRNAIGYIALASGHIDMQCLLWGEPVGWDVTDFICGFHWQSK